jgi:two-component system cell cycle sensor histidine kinase PleC
MRPEDIPTALQRFGQVDAALSRKYEGTGLGLPLSKQLIELHGGRLDIESSIGVGTTVTIRLPTKQVDYSERAQMSVSAASDHSRQLRHVG